MIVLSAYRNGTDHGTPASQDRCHAGKCGLSPREDYDRKEMKADREAVEAYPEKMEANPEK
jgi:hypothetical protein